MREPNFENLANILRKKPAARPTLYESFIGYPTLQNASGLKDLDVKDPINALTLRIKGYHALGFDFAVDYGCSMLFQAGEIHSKASRSLNEGAVISDRASFEAYPWPNPEDYDYSRLEKAREILPDGMKMHVISPGGILENVITLVGFESLCMMLYDDPELVQMVFDEVGVRLLKYHEICAGYDSVGIVMYNDDWGYNTQTMLSTEDMRKYVIPWHKRSVEAIHEKGKLATLHSCGQLAEVMDDIIDVIGYDGKHSYEDNITPVEEAYDRWSDRIAVLGGIDVDFICRSKPEEIKKRARAMLNKTAAKGSYALGTGNSVPGYMPEENYLALLSVGLEG